MESGAKYSNSTLHSQLFTLFLFFRLIIPKKKFIMDYMKNFYFGRWFSFMGSDPYDNQILKYCSWGQTLCPRTKGADFI